MPILSGLVTALFGRFFQTITIPVICLLALTFAHQLWKVRDARLIAQGERVCDAKWEAQIRQQERQQVEADIRAGRRFIEIDQSVTEGVTNDIRTLNESLEILRLPSGGADGKCLSDGVLQRLERGEVGRSNPAHPKPPS